MRIFKKAVTSAAAVGLIAFGAVAGSGGTAHAATDQSLNGCDATYGIILGLSLLPTCTAGDSTIANPTSVSITLNTSSLGSILNLLGLGVKATWTLTCTVDGNQVSSTGSFQVKSLSTSATDVIDLQSAVGSPNPSSCTVKNLKATSLASLTALTLNLITIGASASADTGVPGAVYANYPSDSDGAHAVVCADDTGNGNSGTNIQAYQCLSDLADQWIQMGTGQFVHNGDCLTDTGSYGDDREVHREPVKQLRPGLELELERRGQDDQRRRQRLPHRAVVGDDRRRPAAGRRLQGRRRPELDGPERHPGVRRN